MTLQRAETTRRGEDGNDVEFALPKPPEAATNDPTRTQPKPYGEVSGSPGSDPSQANEETTLNNHRDNSDINRGYGSPARNVGVSSIDRQAVNARIGHEGALEFEPNHSSFENSGDESYADGSHNRSRSSAVAERDGNMEDFSSLPREYTGIEVEDDEDDANDHASDDGNVSICSDVE